MLLAKGTDLRMSAERAQHIVKTVLGSCTQAAFAHCPMWPYAAVPPCLYVSQAKDSMHRLAAVSVCAHACRYYTPAWEAGPSTQQQAAGTSSSKGVQRQAGTRNTAVQRPAGTSSAAKKQAPIASNKRLDPSRSYYSFETGGVHFVMLDSESPSGPDSPQGKFVAQDLAKVRQHSLCH